MKEGNMKKAFFLVLLVPILTIGLISCDASIRSNIADFMGGFSGNVYVEAGLVEPNSDDVEAAVAIVSALGTSSESVSTLSGGSTDAFNVGINVTVAADSTILKPQSTADQTTLKTDLAATLNSPTQTATLLTELAKPITDSAQKKVVADTVTVFNDTLTALKGQLTGDAELQTAIDKLTLPAVDATNDTLTQGDVLVLQMMTNLVANTVTKLKAINSDLTLIDNTAIENNKTDLLTIVDDALFTAQMAEQISGAASIDFSGQLDLASLLDSLDDDSSSSIKSRADEPIDLGDATEFLATINGIVPDVLDLMGVTKSGETFVYTEAKYKSFILNQKAYRSAMEHGMTFKRKGGIDRADLLNANLDTSTLIKYALAVFVTEHEAYISAKGSNTGYGLILSFLNANPKLGNGTLTDADQLFIPETVGDYYDNWPKFLYYGNLTSTLDADRTRSSTYYKNIVNTLLEINKSGGIAQLTEELEKFRDNTDATDEGGLAGWYAGLIL